MSTKLIPQQIIVTCDCCQQKIGDRVKRARGGKLILEQAALDYQGSPVANGTVSYDLCDSCLDLISAAIDNTVAAYGKEKS